jgi:hypothetical protein
MTDGSSFLLCSTSGDFEIYSDDERVQKLLLYKVEKCDVNDGSCDKNYVLLTDEEFLHFMEFIRKEQRQQAKKNDLLHLKQKIAILRSETLEVEKQIAVAEKQLL